MLGIAMENSNTESYFLKEIENATCSKMRKCWLMTAVSVLPHSFAIRLQAFRGAEMDSDVEEAAKQLLFMYTNFAKEARLFNIMCKCISEVQQTARDGFYAGVFRKLPVEKQCSILLKYAEMQTDELDRCKSILFVLSNYSEHQAHNVAVDFIDQLLANEKQYCETEVLNDYARMLVCDVLPVVLRSAHVPLYSDGKKLQKLFVRSVQYCVCSATRRLLQDEESIGTSARHGHSEVSSHSWQLLGSLVSGFLRHFQCESLANTLANVARGGPGEQQAADEALSEWSTLRAGVRKALAESKSHSQAVRGAVCWTVALLLRCAAAYVRDSLRTAPNVGSAKRDGELRSPTRRTAGDDGQLRVSVLLPAGADELPRPAPETRPGALVGHLRVAIACWSFLLATDSTQKEFQKVLEHVLARGDWFWLKLFEIDMCLLHADWRDACDSIATARQLLNVRTSGSLVARLRPSFSAQLAARFELQQASCCKQLGETLPAARHALRCLTELRNAPMYRESKVLARFNADESAQGAAASQSNAYLVTTCTQESVLPMAVRFMVDALRLSAREPGNDSTNLSKVAVEKQLEVASCLVVLAQFTWPRFAQAADEALRSLDCWLKAAQRVVVESSDCGLVSCPLFLNRMSRLELLETLMRVVNSCDATKVRFVVQTCEVGADKLLGLNSAETRIRLIQHVRDHLADAHSSSSSLCEFLVELHARFDSFVAA